MSLEPLAALASLQELDAGGSSFVTGVETLTGLTALRSLKLPDTIVTRDQYLHIVDISRARVDAVTSLLRALASLESIDLSSALEPFFPFKNDAVVVKYRDMVSEVLAALSSHKGLRSLDLSSCGGWVRAHDATGLAALTSLTHLRLGDWECVDMKMITPLTALRSLDLHGSPNVCFDDDAGDGLTALAALTYLKISDTRFRCLDGGKRPETVDVGRLTALTALKELDMHAMDVRDITKLSAFAGLETLALSWCWLSETVLGDFLELPSLTSLELSRCDERASWLLSERGGAAPTRLSALRTLRIDASAMRVCALAEFPSLRRLGLLGGSFQSLEPLAELGALEVLDVDENTDAPDLSSVLDALRRTGVKVNTLRPG